MQLSKIRLDKSSFNELKGTLLPYLDKDCAITFSNPGDKNLTYHYLDSDEEEASCVDFYRYEYLIKNEIDYFSMFHRIISMIYYDHVPRLMEFCKDQLMEDEEFKRRLTNFIDKEVNALIKCRIKEEIRKTIDPNYSILNIYTKAIDELKKECLLE